MYKKKRKNIIVVLILIVVSILLIFLSLFFSKKDYFIETMMKDISLFFNNLTLSIFDSENDICNEKADEELKYQLDILKETLELNNTLNEFTKINAIIINRDLNFWNDTITLNKGSNDGVEAGDAVVVNSGLIGRIISVSNYNSIARLLTSEVSNKISVKIESNGEYAYGLITEYDEKNNIYSLEGISETIEIKEDANVTTTGIGNNFPSGLVMGKVKNITTDSYDLAKLIEITPSVNFNNLSVVTILKREV